MLSDLVDHKTVVLDESNIIMINGSPEKIESKKSPAVKGETITNKQKESGRKVEAKKEKES